METRKLADLSEIISSIAIVITLIFLTVEVRQNTKALYAQSRQSVLTAGQSELFAVLENPDIALSIIKADPLTQEENVRLDLWLTAVMRGREFSWLQFYEGLIDQAQWNAEVNTIAIIFDSVRTRQWWEKSGRAAFGPGFAEFVDDLLRNRPAKEEVWNNMANWSNS